MKTFLFITFLVFYTEAYESPDDDVCQLDKVVGMCKAAFPRYYYDKLTQKCEKFIYGGCGGNGNNFETRKECEDKCLDEDECPANEVYKECGTACPETCSNLGIKIKCIALCVEGCFCKVGYVRSDEGVCIKPENCPKVKCGKNEVYSTCVNPCNDCETRGKCQFLVCNKGCDCKKGYYRDSKGVCIPASKCPCKNECPANEVYKECGTACPKTCSNMIMKIACIDKCVEGCFCKDGYVRNDKGVCIDPQNCPNPKSHCPKKNPWVCVRASNKCCTDLDCPKPQICCQENCGNSCRDPVPSPTEGQRVCDPGCPLDPPSKGMNE